jgi:hypothetical protein
MVEVAGGVFSDGMGALSVVATTGAAAGGGIGTGMAGAMLEAESAMLGAEAEGVEKTGGITVSDAGTDAEGAGVGKGGV